MIPSCWWPHQPDPLTENLPNPPPAGLLPSTQTHPTPTQGPEPRLWKGVAGWYVTDPSGLLFLKDVLPWQPEIDKNVA